MKEVASSINDDFEHIKLSKAKRVVLKIGSRALLRDPNCFVRFADQIAQQKHRDMVVVSSGAIAFGRAILGLEKRPNDISTLQAAAATGQSRLIHSYENAFAAHEIQVAQILLTHSDLADRERYERVQRVIDTLLKFRVIPIINENDTVAVEEIKFGDNDQLAAMVAGLIDADLLVLLSDVDGVQDDHYRRIEIVRNVDDALPFIRSSEHDIGTGGMKSKLEAARKATLRGIPVVIADFQQDNLLSRLLQGERLGTFVLPHV